MGTARSTEGFLRAAPTLGIKRPAPGIPGSGRCAESNRAMEFDLCVPTGSFWSRSPTVGSAGVNRAEIIFGLSAREGGALPSESP